VSPASVVRSGTVERVSWTLGVLVLAGAAGAYLHGVVSSRRLLTEFAGIRAEARDPAGAARYDLSLWSTKRIEAWEASLSQAAPEAMAVLRIPRIDLEVPVLPGTDDWTLNRAVGHIEDTAVPGQRGNVGIAGHRDGFFRGLKDVSVGDLIEVESPTGTTRYFIERIWTVKPEDVSVLDPTPAPSVTLVTCYPFYFVGSAPERYIVRASAVAPGTH
jgi:sortase A